MASHSPATLASVNALEQAAFIEAIGWVFEDSPWVAAAAWFQRPFVSVDALHAAMTVVVAGADRKHQLELLYAHPDLGTRARMSGASTGEQAGAGLDSLTPQQFVHLRRLNAAYLGKFGFPFIYAVKDSTPDDIVRALEQRVAASADDEFAEALRQVYRIARFRLNEIFGPT